MSEKTNFFVLPAPPRRELPWKATQESNGASIDTVLVELSPLKEAAAQSLAVAKIRKYVPETDRSPELTGLEDKVEPFPSTPGGAVVLSEQACQMAARLQYAQKPPTGQPAYEFNEIVWMMETAPDVYAEGIRVLGELSKHQDDGLGNPKEPGT